MSLCVLQAIRDALNKSRMKDREALAEGLKEIYWAESQGEAKEALGSLGKREEANQSGGGVSG